MKILIFFAMASIAASVLCAVISVIYIGVALGIADAPPLSNATLFLVFMLSAAVFAKEFARCMREIDDIIRKQHRRRS